MSRNKRKNKNKKQTIIELSASNFSQTTMQDMITNAIVEAQKKIAKETEEEENTNSNSKNGNKRFLSYLIFT